MVIQPGGASVGLALVADTTSVATAIPTLENGDKPKWVHVAMTLTTTLGSLAGIRFGSHVLAAPKSVTTGGITDANPVLVNATGHGYTTGLTVYIEGAEQTELNGRYFVVTRIGADSFTLDGEDGTGRTATTAVQGTAKLDTFVSAATYLNSIGFSGNASIIVNVSGQTHYTAKSLTACTISVTPLAGISTTR